MSFNNVTIAKSKQVNNNFFMDDFKHRVRLAVENFNRKQLQSEKAPRKYTHPELAVQNEIIKWCRDNGISIDVVDASSAWSPETQSYSRVHVTAGFPDSVGCLPNGRAIYIEFKAKSKRATLKPHQREFLIEKINHNAFACCTDSLEHFKQLLFKWKAALDLGNPKQILLDDLPNKKEKPLTWDD